MMTAVHGMANEAYVATRGPLPDAEVDRLEAAALKGMLNNRFTPEVQALVDDFVAFGNDGIESLLEHFNEKLSRFWSPYRLRIEPEEGAQTLTIKLMRMENGRLQPSGPTVQVGS
jgi:hypothetical protein